MICLWKCERIFQPLDIKKCIKWHTENLRWLSTLMYVCVPGQEAATPLRDTDWGWRLETRLTHPPHPRPRPGHRAPTAGTRGTVPPGRGGDCSSKTQVSFTCELRIHYDICSRLLICSTISSPAHTCQRNFAKFSQYLEGLLVGFR